MPGMIQKMTLSSVFMAFGILFPLVFHTIGLGSIFLPMYWPVAAAGYFLPLTFTILVSVLIPVVSFLLTGMPQPPILQVMIPELVVLAATIHLLYRKAGLAIWPSLFFGLLASRAVLFLIAGLFGRVLGLPPKWASAAMLLKSLPGVVAILILVSSFIGRLLHESLFHQRKNND
jgi:hypothetical protein